MELLVTAAAFVIGSMADPILAVIGIAAGVALAKNESGWALIIGVVGSVALLTLTAILHPRAPVEVLALKHVAVALWAGIIWLLARVFRPAS